MKKFTILLSSILFTLSVSLADNHSEKLPVESDYYPITTIPLPEGEVIEVSGIDVLPGNKVAIASRRGDIFVGENVFGEDPEPCLLYTSPSPRDRTRSRMPSSA